MQINLPNWGVVVFKINEVSSPQRSLQILFSTNFFRNGRKMMQGNKLSMYITQNLPKSLGLLQFAIF